MRNFLLFLLLFSFASYAQDSGKSCEVLFKINTLIQREHFQPKPVDDSLSVFVFETLMADLDTDKNIFYPYLKVG